MNGAIVSLSGVGTANGTAWFTAGFAAGKIASSPFAKPPCWDGA
jgi:hypothetical protein